MGFAVYEEPSKDKATSYYPDGTPKETANPIEDMRKPNPIGVDQTPDITPKKQEIIPPQDETLSHQKFIIDTFHNMTSVNTDRYAQVIDDLKGYAEGSPILVTYYKMQYAETNSKGVANDMDIENHQSHKSALKIHGFEIRLTQSLSYEHDASDAVSRLTGEALTYPGFEPSKGDKLVLEVETGKWGVFTVTEIPTRLAIKSSTYFKIVFSLVAWMSKEHEKELDEFVFTEAYFDKKRFLNESGALLYHAEYVDMKFMELQSAQMMKYYVTKFLDRKFMFTYMRPDSVYDPYVVDFMMKISDYAECGQVAAQLFRDAPAIENSIWRALLSETVPLACVPTSSIISTYTLGSKSVLVNSLLNRKYLAWEPNSASLEDFFAAEDNGELDGDPCDDLNPEDLDGGDADKIIGDVLLHIHPHYHECVLTCCGECSECCGDTVNDDTNSALAYLLDGSAEYKELIRLFLKYRKINVTNLRKCIKDVYKLPLLQQFYKMPVYIVLARTCVRYIHRTSGIYE